MESRERSGWALQAKKAEGKKERAFRHHPTTRETKVEIKIKPSVELPACLWSWNWRKRMFA